MSKLISQYFYIPLSRILGLQQELDKKETSDNRKTDLSTNSDSYYPSVKAVQSALDGKLSSDIVKTSLAEDSDLYIPTQKAVKTAIDNAGGGGFQYSTTEAVNTGNKWIDGKDIWVQVIDFGALPNGNKDTPVFKEVYIPNTILSVRDTTTDLRGIALQSDDLISPLPYAWSESGDTKPMITLQGYEDKIRIRTLYDWSSYIAYVYIFFTKT